MMTQFTIPDEIAAGFENWLETLHAAMSGIGKKIPEGEDFRSELRIVWAYSDFVSRNCIKSPDVMIDLVESGDLHRKYLPGCYLDRIRSDSSEAADEAMFGRRIRKVRLREMIRIAWRELAGLADLSETMEELSDFADACIEQTVSTLYSWHTAERGVPASKQGAPQRLVVVGMGKLGGRELNFSSDVDLIFAYPEPGCTGGDRPLTNEEFFSRLCRRIIHVLGATSDEGMVFRVDMRLRPDGESGPIVMSFDNMVDYYQSQGREWERYAWIKARVVAGDRTAGKALLERLRPFVYRRYFDYGAFESLREMKEKISREVQRKGMEKNIKLGPGGIREIEFFGQIFQLIRGGVFPPLQEPRIREVLKILAAENEIYRGVCRELDEAYVFLRRTEHRLQEASDQQTHELPGDPNRRIRLASAMGFCGWSSFSDAIGRHMNRVHMHFSELLEAKESEGFPESDNSWTDIWMGTADEERSGRILSALGYDDPGTVLRILDQLRQDRATRVLSPDGRRRLDRLIPMILRETAISDQPAQTLSRILELVKTVQRRTNYLALLGEKPEALKHLVKLADASPWIISFSTRHPVVLDELLNDRKLYAPPKRQALQEELRTRLAMIPEQELEYKIEEMCVFKQVNTLRVAAADVIGELPLMKVSDRLSDIAETIVGEVFQLAWRDLADRHGEPVCILDGSAIDRGFAVIAYGKLGGLELGYDSDLDMVFLHAAAGGRTLGGSQSIENAYFFARLGQRIVHILTTHTAAGFLYETDMRLRPSGGSGPLVSHLGGFTSYQMEEAWTWEHQALVRARPICGNAILTESFKRVRREILSKPRHPEKLRSEVGSMRERLRRQLLGSAPGFDLRQGDGGMVDIEFIVQYLVLLHSRRHIELTEWTDNVRQIHMLAKTGVIRDEIAHLLKEAYLTYRFALHRLSLQEKPARVPDSRFKALRGFVKKVRQRYLHI
jgi:glutamate-ammonia-ligase adenylyltransferase